MQYSIHDIVRYNTSPDSGPARKEARNTSSAQSSPVSSQSSTVDHFRAMFMKKRRAAELLAELHRPPTPPSSDQESDGDTAETKLPKLSPCKEEDKMLAKVNTIKTL